MKNQAHRDCIKNTGYVAFATDFCSPELRRACTLRQMETFKASYLFYHEHSIWSLNQSSGIQSYIAETLVIFRPYFIWERKIFKSNGFFFTKFAKILFIFKFKGVTHRIQPT